MDHAQHPKSSSRIAGFYKFSVGNRLQVLFERGFLSEQEYQLLMDGGPIMTVQTADRLVENVIATLTLPLGLGLNFSINNEDFLVPMSVEEPSIIAAVSSVAKLARNSGGFKTHSNESLLIGQVQVLQLTDLTAAKRALFDQKDEIINLANSLHPNMVARGGGAQDLEIITYPDAGQLVVHLLVDTCDAMGANLVNTMCEGIAALIEKITGGEVGLRILSNLTDRSLVHAKTTIRCADLATDQQTGQSVRDSIIKANQFALIDPHRAATHNKGIMNGIDAVALATGNDWRAIEAGVHAYAAQDGRYRALTRWYANEEGDLVGELTLPLKVGTVGGQIKSNRAVQLAHSILGRPSAKALAEVMAAVGLAQNLAAIKALSTEGIQQGHMSLHARSIAAAAGAKEGEFDWLVEALIASGEIKLWKARELLSELRHKKPNTTQTALDVPQASGSDQGFGKIILIGEHSVVYGRQAIAAPIPLSVHASVRAQAQGVHMLIPRWGIEMSLDGQGNAPSSLHQSLTLIIQRLGLSGHGMQIEVAPHIPRANGLGASAALAVAVIRAMARCFEVHIDDDAVCALAYDCEKFAHGTPSGVDNTLATYGQALAYTKTAQGGQMTPLQVKTEVPIVIGLSGVQTLTAQTVGRVRQAWQTHPKRYERLFDQIHQLSLAAKDALKLGELEELGDLMNINQGLLNALQVSHPKLETMINIARNHGALGAKLTGGGGGGAIIALTRPNHTQPIAQALREAGFQSYITQINPLADSVL